MAILAPLGNAGGGGPHFNAAGFAAGVACAWRAGAASSRTQNASVKQRMEALRVGGNSKLIASRGIGKRPAMKVGSSGHFVLKASKPPLDEPPLRLLPGQTQCPFVRLDRLLRSP